MKPVVIPLDQIPNETQVTGSLTKRGALDQVLTDLSRNRDGYDCYDIFGGLGVHCDHLQRAPDTQNIDDFGGLNERNRVNFFWLQKFDFPKFSIGKKTFGSLLIFSSNERAKICRFLGCNRGKLGR